MPASRQRSTMRRAPSASVAPTLANGPLPPNVIVPSVRTETFRPDRPRTRYSIVDPPPRRPSSRLLQREAPSPLQKASPMARRTHSPSWPLTPESASVSVTARHAVAACDDAASFQAASRPSVPFTLADRSIARPLRLAVRRNEKERAAGAALEFGPSPNAPTFSASAGTCSMSWSRTPVAQPSSACSCP